MWKLFGFGGGTAAPAINVEAAARAAQARRDIAQVELIGQLAVVTLTAEEFSQEIGAARLADLIDHLASHGVLHLVLDIQNVRFMDSACMGCLVNALNRLARSGGHIALANPAASVAHLFRLTRLDRIFPICADVMAAVNLVERSINGEE
jgi:anti-sigma B factor antagonist